MNKILNFYFKNNFLTKKYEKIINEILNFDEKKILEIYNYKFLFLFNKVISSSPFYKTLYSNHGINKNDIRSIEDIIKLPVITSDYVKLNFKNIATGFKPISINGYTSGTTGSPLTLKRDISSVIWEQAYINSYRSLFGFKTGDRLISLRGKLGKNQLYQNDRISNILYISTPALNHSNAIQVYDLISRFKPMAIEGYPSYLFKLCEEFETLNLSINIPIAFTSSETLNVFFAKKIKKVLNTKVYDWYGNAERTIVLAHNNDLKYFPLPLYSLNEFHDDHLLTTSLINSYFPLIRYQVNDVIKVNKNNYLRDFVNPDIISINGRVAESIELKDGSVVACIDYVFKEIDYLEVAQVYQKYPGSDIDVKIVTSEKFGDFEKFRLMKRIRWILGNEIGVNIIKSSRKDLIFSEKEKYKLIIKGNIN
jgi:phenylacetate-CoA ligase